VHGTDELETAGVIRDLVQRIAGRADDGDDPRALQAEIERLRSQNENMKRAMRHCIDCEYRVEVMATRANEGRTAAGGGSPTD
jgi:hypothetical protein